MLELLSLTLGQLNPLVLGSGLDLDGATSCCSCCYSIASVIATVFTPANMVLLLAAAAEAGWKFVGGLTECPGHSKDL